MLVMLIYSKCQSVICIKICYKVCKEIFHCILSTVTILIMVRNGETNEGKEDLKVLNTIYIC